MVKQRTYVEVGLLGVPIMQSESLDELVNNVRADGFRISELSADPVVINGVNRIVSKPIIYLEKEGRSEALILRGEDDKYNVYKYRQIG